MKLSPLDIYDKEFKKSALGYNTGEVDEFLDDVGVAYEKLLKEINSLKDENDKLKSELENYEKFDKKLQDTLTAIQKTVEEEKRRAREEAEYIKREARKEAEKIKEKARKDVKKEYKKIKELKEKKKLFEIRFRTFLESHLELIEDNEETDVNISLEEYEEDIAASSEEETELD